MAYKLCTIRMTIVVSLKGLLFFIVWCGQTNEGSHTSGYCWTEICLSLFGFVISRVVLNKSEFNIRLDFSVLHTLRGLLLGSVCDAFYADFSFIFSQSQKQQLRPNPFCYIVTVFFFYLVLFYGILHVSLGMLWIC